MIWWVRTPIFGNIHVFHSNILIIHIPPKFFFKENISANMSFPSPPQKKKGAKKWTKLVPAASRAWSRWRWSFMNLNRPQEIRIRISSFGDKTRFFLKEKGRGLVFFFATFFFEQKQELPIFPCLKKLHPKKVFFPQKNT